MCWALMEAIPATILSQGPPRVWYRVDRLGTLLLESEDTNIRPPRGVGAPPAQVILGEQIINIGFLRLAGISDPGGRSFLVRGVFTTEGLQETSRRILEATKRLVTDYMRPVDLRIIMATEGGKG
jgi:hypothetical protein